MSATSGRRFLTPGLVALVAAAALVAGAMWAWRSVSTARRAVEGSPLLGVEGPDGALPVLGQVPDFSFIGSDGSALRRRDLQGVPWVGNFIFTTCAGVCPVMSSQMARLQNELPEDSPVRLISITVDPRNDTPQVLSLYARRFGARPDRWLFLTGEPEEIYRLAREGFHLSAGELPDYDPAQDDGPFFHSTRMALVDTEGRIRGYYEGTESDQVDRLARDLARLTQ